MDIRKIFEQAQQMQGRLQSEMESTEVEADSGGGMVRVRMNGKKELVALVIERNAVSENDLPMLQDLIIAAVNQATRKVDQVLAGKLGSLANQLNLPGL